jgi:hypothetical protein
LSKLVAVAAPLLVLAGPVAWWARPDPPATLSPAAANMERAVEGDPDVLLLGASKVYTDLDKDAIAQGLGLPKSEVVPLNVSGTTAPVWYAILKNRVYDTGKKPKLAIVYSTFDWALAAQPSGEAERAVLLAQMGNDEDVLRRKALGEGPGGATWERVRRRRTEAHGGLMSFLRNFAVGATLAEPGEAGVTAAGEAMATPALEGLFGMQAGLDLTQTHGAIPIVEQARVTEKVASSLEDTLLPDFLAIAAEHGTRIVFVHAPVRMSLEPGYLVEPGLHRAAVQAINDAGQGYMDLRELRLGDAAFGDGAHLNKVGRTSLTEALIERLRAMDAMGSGPMKPAALPVVTTPPVVTRTGSPPELTEVKPLRGPKACGWEAPIPELRPLNDFSLQSAGFGMVSPLLLLEDGKPLEAHAPREKFDDACAGAFLHQEKAVKFSPTGDSPDVVPTRSYRFSLSEDLPLRTSAGFEAWWVYPGTTVTLSFEEPTSGPGVVVDALAFAGGKGSPTAWIDSAPPSPFGGEAQHRSIVLPPPRAGAPWSLSIASPADGPYLLLRRVVHGPTDSPAYTIGAPGSNSVAVITADAKYAGPPPALPPLAAPAADGETTSTFALDPATVPDTEVLWKLASVAGCSPVRLSEDGKPLAAPTVRPKDVPAAAGRYAQSGTTLTVTGSDQTAPHANGRAYAATLDETRRCRGLRWLYPGDSLTLTVKPSLLGPLLSDATRLELGGAAVAEATPAIGRLRVSSGGTTYLDTTFSLQDLAATPPSWTIDPPLPRGPDPVIIDVSIPPDAPFTLLTSLALTEPGLLPTAAPVTAEAAP